MPDNRERPVLRIGAIAGILVTLPLIAVMVLGSVLFGLPVVAFDLFEQLTRIQILGPLVTKGIDIMVGIFSRMPFIATDVASKAAEQLIAVLFFLFLGAIAGMLFAR